MTQSKSVPWQPTIVPMPLGDPFDTPVRGLRVALYTDDGVYPATADVAAAVHSAADVLADAGALVTEARPPGVEGWSELFGRAFSADWW